jgi:hypothetical protein
MCARMRGTLWCRPVGMYQSDARSRNPRSVELYDRTDLSKYR